MVGGKGGEYDFPILVVCLMILALQIHNPFQAQLVCRCGDGDDAAASAPSAGGRRGSTFATEPAAGARPRFEQQEQPAPNYRRAAPPQQGGQAGLSTDALLRELDSIQAKAQEQQEVLTSTGRMPPPSPVLQQLKDAERAEGLAPQPPSQQSWGGAQLPPTQQPPTLPGQSGQASWRAGAGHGPPPGSLAPVGQPLLQRRDDFGRFLEARQPRGLGVVLGVGRGDFALRLLRDWGSSQGVYLVDPFIHIWRGYDDPANLSDKEHQVQFENLRNQLAPYEGRYVLIRDFSYSFAETYRQGIGTQVPGPPTFVYVDANHAETGITRDLELWWPLLASGGVLAGSTYADDDVGRVRVRSAVDRFAAIVGVQMYLTHDDVPPSWFIVKG